MFLNTAGNRLNGEQEGALADFMERGGGFVGIGPAAEGEPGSAFFDDLIGARPDPASPSRRDDSDARRRRPRPSDDARPAARALNRTDVWYRWQTRPTGIGAHGRALPRARRAGGRRHERPAGTDHPISWCRDVRGGRSFYMGMGRTADGYGRRQRFRTHLLGAIQWATGMVRGNCKATINANYRGTRVVSGGAVETGLATSGESHGLSIAPNGWVIYIGRGDCRTDDERGALIGAAGASRGSSTTPNQNVGLGCGNVHVWDPAQYTGTVNSGVTQRRRARGLRRRRPGRRAHEPGEPQARVGPARRHRRAGLQETGHIYMQYFPSFNRRTARRRVCRSSAGYRR